MSAPAPPHGEPAGGPTYPAAGLDRRFYAFVLDRVVAWGLYALVGFLAFRFLDALWVPLGALAGTVLVVSTAFAVLLGVAGVSPGKAAAGLRVVRHDAGTPIGVGPAFVRTLVLGLSALPTAGFGAATLAWTALMDPSRTRRGWHDRVASSVVVDVRPVPDLPESDEQVERPRQVINLTAMRLMPAPAEPEPSGPVASRVPDEKPQVTGSAGGFSSGTPAPAARNAWPEPKGAPASTTSGPSGPSTQPGSATPPPGAPPAERPTHPGAPVPPAPRQAESPTVTSAPADRWRVTFDTGETLLVEGLVLVGRRPQPRRGEHADHLMALRSEDMSLSKTHAQFQVTPEGALVVMDRGSTNGSMLIRQGVAKQLSAGRATTLVAGDQVRFGDREMLVARE